MLGIKELLKDRDGIERRLKSKDPEISLGPVIEAYEEMCRVKAEVESEQSKLNQLSREIGKRKAEKKGDDSESARLMEEVAEVKRKVHSLSESLPGLEERYEGLISLLPNIPDEDLKVALDPKENVCVKMWGEKPQFDFTPKNHVELNEKLGFFDFKRGAKLSGSGWPIYSNLGARLEWALINFMLDIHQKNGFTFYMVPHLVQRPVMYGSGQLPKFEKQLFKVTDEDYDLFLIPTAEVALNGLHSDEILDEADLPKLYVSYTPCFRREAGAAGSNERGLIRVHQFNKVEMFAFTTPEGSAAIFDKMVASAEEILQALELHHRNMLLVTGDTSFGAARTIDVEVWLPGQNRYYEVSSISNCRDFQARRSKIRYRANSEEGKNRFVHTLNGSGLATSRLMVALLENSQRADGSIRLPTALTPYLGSAPELFLGKV